MFSLFLFLVFVLAAYGMYLHFSRPRYRTIRTLEQPLPQTTNNNDQVSISVNVPVTGVVWTRGPVVEVVEEEEIFVDSPMDPLDLMMDAMTVEEVIDEGPMVIESGYGYGADVLDEPSYDEVDEVDDVDYGSSDSDF